MTRTHVALAVALAALAGTVAAVLSAGCKVYQPIVHEVTPTCDVTIDYVHHATEVEGDCDAGDEQ